MIRGLYRARLGFLLALGLLCAEGLTGPEARAEDLGLLIERTVAPGERLPILVSSDQPGPVQVRRWRLDPEAARAYAARTDAGSGEPAPVPSRRPDYEGTFPLPTAGARARLDLPAAEPGLHVIEVSRSKDLQVRAHLLVSDLALVTKRHPGGVLVWAVHRATGRPWPGVEIDVPGASIPRTQSGSDGLWRSEQPVPATLWIRGEAGAHLAFGEDTWFSPDVNDRRVYAFAHQPAYRPGEQVEIKGVVRAYHEGRHALDPLVREVLLQVRDPEGRIVEAATVGVDAALGTFHGSFPLGASAPTGAWQIVATIAGDEYAAPLRVEAYRKPAFEVRVEADPAQALAGAPLRFRVEAAFYDGGRLAGAPISWQILHNRVDRDLFPTDELVRLFFGTERSAYEPVTLSTGEGTLGPDGQLEIPAVAPTDAQDGWITLRATVTGPDRIAVSGSGGLAIAAAPLRVGLSTDKHLYGPEDIVGVDIRVERADGAPAGVRSGTLALRRLDATGAWQDAGAPPRPIETGAQGRARLHVPLPGEGHFQLRVSIEAGPGFEPVVAALEVWAAAERPTLGVAPSDLEVVVDKDHHAVGETARLLVRAPAGMAVLATLEGARLYRTEVLTPTGGAATWSVPLRAEHAPNVFVTFALVDQGELRLETRMLRIPPAHNLLHAEIVPDEQSLRPGAQSGLTIRITDADGAPVANADVALRVVDDALFALHPDPSAPLEAFFHPARRNAVQTSGPLRQDAVDFARYAPPAPKKAGPIAHRGGGGPPPPGSAAPSAPAERPAAGGEAPSGDPGAAPMPEPVASMDDGATGGSGSSCGSEMGETLEESEEEARSMDGRVAQARSRNGAGGGTPALSVRSDFRTCVHWAPALRTDADGRIRVEDIRFADSLTRWRIDLRVVDADTRVGSASTFVVTEKKLAVQISAPRFLTQTDRVQVPVLLRNLMRTPVEAAYEVEASGGAAASSEDGPVHLEAGATEVRYLPIQAAEVGEAEFRATLRAGQEGDAEARRFDVHPQGIERVDGHARLSEGGRVATKIRVPASAVAGTIRCRVSVEPSMLSAVSAALPYLVDYPHGCTEQTVSRFVPLVIAARAAETLGMPAQGRLAEVPAMLEAGIARLSALQQRDGGYGWWPTDGASPLMTAQVLRGLNAASPMLPKESAGHELRTQATRWLQRALEDKGRRQALTPEAHASAMVALAGAGALPKNALQPLLRPDALRGSSPLARAWLLRAAVDVQDQALIALLRRSLEGEALRTDGQASWALSQPGGSQEGPTSQREDPIETTAEVAYALLRAGGDGDLVADAARWLLLQRPGGTYWRSTRDSAAAVRFLAAHAVATGDYGSGETIHASVDAVGILDIRVTKETLFSGATTIEVPSSLLQPGRELDLMLSTPRGSFTAGIHVTYFETGPAIAAGSNGLSVVRRWYRLEPEKTSAGVVWKRTPLSETVPSGTLIECEIEIQSEQAQTFVMVRDPHAAGFEPAREYGMEVPGRAPALPAEVQGYDDRTLFFLSTLPAGTTFLRHTVRATHVGTFTALPAQAELMYFPEVSGYSAGEVLEITAQGPVGIAAGGAK